MHHSPHKGLEILRGRGRGRGRWSSRPRKLKENMKLNWKLLRGRGSWRKSLSRGGTTTQATHLIKIY